MKNYLLFTHIEYEAWGGMNDFKGSYDSIEECLQKFKSNKSSVYDEYAHILSLQDDKIYDITDDYKIELRDF